MKNALIYTENNELIVRKANGLQYEFKNVDRPELGFDYEVLVYDEPEVKILSWKEGVEFKDQKADQLNEVEMDAIETYISNSEAPAGVTLNSQYVNQISEICSKNLADFANQFGFEQVAEVVFAGREGSNHPYRSNARRVMEYGDANWVIFDKLMNQIFATREDMLEPFESYANQFPNPMPVPGQAFANHDNNSDVNVI